MNGVFTPVSHVKVITWPSADENGDGKPLKVKGNYVKGPGGKPICNYKRPKGFRNFRSFDGTDNFVMVDDWNEPYRDPDGCTIQIQPGWSVVIDAHGRATYLTTDDEREHFAATHSEVNATDLALPASQTMEENADPEQAAENQALDAFFADRTNDPTDDVDEGGADEDD
jgi:hypothetical protein